MSQAFSPDFVQYLRKQEAQIAHNARVLGQQEQKLTHLGGIVEGALRRTSVQRSGGLGGVDFERRNSPMARDPDKGGYVSLDAISGRHVPFDLMVSIPIEAGQVGPQTASAYISPDGPFVAVARYAIFESTHSIQVTDDNGAVSTFFSRTNGRFRPISSSTDVMDAVRAFDQPSQYQPSYLTALLNSGGQVLPIGNPVGVNAQSDAQSLFRLLPNWPGNGLPIIASPFSMSSGRSMAFDGLISVDTKGSQIKRQDNPIPSTFWTDRDGGMVKLATLDVFEPNETVTFVVEPQHPNNPDFGNIQNLGYFNTNAGWDTFDPATGIASGNAAPPGLFPTRDGQFDGHEGIDAASRPGDTSTTTESVTRNPSGILHIGYFGYRILQPPAIVR
jgi:hypothetical protein